MTHDPSPPYRLAPCTSSQLCVPRTLSRLRSTFHSTPNRLHCGRPVHMRNLFHHHRRKIPHTAELDQAMSTIQNP